MCLNVSSLVLLSPSDDCNVVLLCKGPLGPTTLFVSAFALYREELPLNMMGAQQAAQ